MKEFGERLREIREFKGLSQKQLALVLNVSNRTVSTWEIGRNEPDQATTVKIAKYFEVSTDFLLGLED